MLSEKPDRPTVLMGKKSSPIKPVESGRSRHDPRCLRRFPPLLRTAAKRFISRVGRDYGFVSLPNQFRWICRYPTLAACVPLQPSSLFDNRSRPARVVHTCTTRNPYLLTRNTPLAVRCLQRSPCSAQQDSASPPNQAENGKPDSFPSENACSANPSTRR